MKRKDIICISTHYWDGFWFRKQHFMSRFHKKGHRILYVQPSFSLVRKKNESKKANNKIFLPLLEKVDENLYLFFPPRSLPKPQSPLSAKFTYKWFGFLVGRAAYKIGMEEPLLWVYKPEYAIGLNYIKYSKLVFDMADDLSAYRKILKQRIYRTSCVEKLVHKADQMIVTSSTLLEKYKSSTSNCICIQNGFDSSLFNGSRFPVPVDMKCIKPPIIGFVGVMFSHLDYDLIHYVVRNHPDKSFVMVGPTEESGKDGVAKIINLPNVYFLGRKERHLIPQYVSNFDLCINPFKIDDVSKSVSPLKVYEYLACGKPVVSTYMKGLSEDGAGEYVYFVNDREGFAKKITESLDTETEEKKSRRMKGASSFSWDILFESVYNVFNNIC